MGIRVDGLVDGLSDGSVSPADLLTFMVGALAGTAASEGARYHQAQLRHWRAELTRSLLLRRSVPREAAGAAAPNAASVVQPRMDS